MHSLVHVAGEQKIHFAFELFKVAEVFHLCRLLSPTITVGLPCDSGAIFVLRLRADSRSLLERFQSQGCPTILLNVQFRMHPAIRHFPSRFFYQDLLQDSPSVLSRPDEPYHADPLLRPFLFFDVPAPASFQTYQNREEARTAVALFMVRRSACQSPCLISPLPLVFAPIATSTEHPHTVPGAGIASQECNICSRHIVWV